MDSFVIHSECQNNEAPIFAVLILQFFEGGLQREKKGLLPTIIGAS